MPKLSLNFDRNARNQNSKNNITKTPNQTWTEQADVENISSCLGQANGLKTGISNKVTDLVDFLTPVSHQKVRWDSSSEILECWEWEIALATQEDLFLTECEGDNNVWVTYELLPQEEITPLIEVYDSSVLQVSTLAPDSINLESVDEFHDSQEGRIDELIEWDAPDYLLDPEVSLLLSLDWYRKTGEESIVESVNPKNTVNCIIEKYESEILENQQVEVLEEIIELFDQGFIESIKEEKWFFECMRDLYQEIQNKLQDIWFNYSTLELDILLIQPKSVLDEVLKKQVLQDLRILNLYNKVLNFGKWNFARTIIDTKLKEKFLEELTYISVPLSQVDWMLPNNTFLAEDISTDTSAFHYWEIVSANFSGSNFKKMWPDTVKNTMSLFTSLSNLNISRSGLWYLSLEMWQAIFSKAHQLKIIDLSRNHLHKVQKPQLEYLLDALKNVRILKMNDNQLNNWSSTNLQLFFSHCWNLYKLDLSWNDLRQFSPSFLKTLFSHLSHIRCLKATHCGLTKEQLQVLFHNPPQIIIG